MIDVDVAVDVVGVVAVVVVVVVVWLLAVGHWSLVVG